MNFVAILELRRLLVCSVCMQTKQRSCRIWANIACDEGQYIWSGFAELKDNVDEGVLQNMSQFIIEETSGFS
jgi:hypothetical protein